MYEIVSYHNDFNKIKLPNFNEQELNLLFSILYEVSQSPNTERFMYYVSDLRRMLNKNITKREIYELMRKFETDFFHANFKILLKDGVLSGIATVHLFNNFKIWYHWNGNVLNCDPDKMITEAIKADPNSISAIIKKLNSEGIWAELERVDFTINKEFRYLIYDLTKEFTRFELREFVSLKSKYSKVLYRVLKQFKNTGKCTIYANKWEDFCNYMGMPSFYPMCLIDSKILNPCIKELSAERNLFTNQAPIFENLTYKKIKDRRYRGRGGKVIGIEFYFTPENKRHPTIEAIKNIEATKQIEREQQQEQIIEQEPLNVANMVNDLTQSKMINQQQEQIIEQEQQGNDNEIVALRQQYLHIPMVRYDGKYNRQETLKVCDIYRRKDNYIEAVFKNVDTQKDFIRHFETKNHFLGYLKTFQII